MDKAVELFYHDKALSFLDMAVKVKVFKGGRGSGKTRCIPEDILDRAEALPKARIFLCSTTFSSIDDNIMPDIREVFKLHGLMEGEDYVVDKKPPEHFEKPYKRIEDPRNSIHLFNGFAIQKVSFGRNIKKYRGRSFDGGIIDEALNLDGWAVENILIPTLRGFDYWDENEYWKMLSVYSSHPRTPEGGWFLKYQKLAESYPELYGWVEATAFDNLAVVGETYIEDQRAILSYIDFNIEILNKGNTKDLPSLFYYQHDEHKHHYQKANLEDVDTNEPLAISIDFGGRYSCITVSQANGIEERIVYEFDTNNLSEEEKQSGKVKKVPDIINDFLEVFRGHACKEVELWGEKAGLDRQEMDERNLFEQIKDQIEEAGWIAEIMADYEHGAMHKTRWLFMNDCFEEQVEDYPIIRINAATCPNLIISLGLTQINDDFKKNKAAERNESFNQSHAPHLTDTLDYKLFGKYFYLLDDDFGGYSGLDGGIDSF